MKNKNGFTLMEMLAVLLVIAVIASLTVPLMQSVRRDMRYQKAKAAGMQLAEAIRSFYTDTKGCLPITPAESSGFYAPDAADATVCPPNHTISTGVRNQCGEDNGLHERIVFACNYVSPKMFVDLPYRFQVMDPRPSGGNNEVFIVGTEMLSDEETGRTFTIYRDMTFSEDEEE